ncbi:MAG: DUF2283 domain-containing protein [Candidatus Gracilibacteria bacterium]|nr:DUF2283 domain-containing protein [Candidatus Gracilibacteria bacterium]
MKIVNLNSELHIDNEADAAYLYLNKEKENKVNYTNSLLDENGGNVNIDFNIQGKIVGIEFIPASKFFK